MVTVAELEAKVAAGGKVAPAELVAAQAAERIAAIEADRAQRIAAHNATLQRQAELQAWCEKYWADVDEATAAAGAAAEGAIAAAEAYNAALHRLRDLAGAQAPSRGLTMPQPPVGVGVIDRSALFQVKGLTVNNTMTDYYRHLEFHRIEDQINAGTLKAICPMCGEPIKPGDGITLARVAGGPKQPRHNDRSCPAMARQNYGAVVRN